MSNCTRCGLEVDGFGEVHDTARDCRRALNSKLEAVEEAAEQESNLPIWRYNIDVNVVLRKKMTEEEVSRAVTAFLIERYGDDIYETPDEEKVWGDVYIFEESVSDYE